MNNYKQQALDWIKGRDEDLYSFSGGAPGVSSLGSGFGSASNNTGLKPLNKDHHEQSIKRAKDWLNKQSN